jgi:hypothetical protein
MYLAASPGERWRHGSSCQQIFSRITYLERQISAPNNRTDPLKCADSTRARNASSSNQRKLGQQSMTAAAGQHTPQPNLPEMDTFPGKSLASLEQHPNTQKNKLFKAYLGECEPIIPLPAFGPSQNRQRYQLLRDCSTQVRVMTADRYHGASGESNIAQGV